MTLMSGASPDQPRVANQKRLDRLLEELLEAVDERLDAGRPKQ
jgi:hypothetical protein